MASRNTLEKAQELKEQFESRHPEAEIRIIDRSNQFGPCFAVLEVRHCNCGAEVLTAAIGELGRNECKDCKTRNAARYEANTRRASRRANAAQAAQDYAERLYDDR